MYLNKNNSFTIHEENHILYIIIMLVCTYEIHCVLHCLFNYTETCADDTMGSSQLGSTTPNTSSNTELTYLYTSVQSDTGTCGQVSRSDDRGNSDNESSI